MFEKSPKIEFASKMQKKGTRRRRFEDSLKWLSHIFQTMIFFTIKNGFFYITFCKITIFDNFHKAVQYVVELYLNICHAKFHVDISIFGKRITQKNISADDVIVSDCVFQHFYISQEVKMTFWNSEVKLVQKHTFFILKYQFENFALYVTRG